ncbi:MAG: murein hydrolase activator EnvC family protein [Oscillospiraceae bacterium]
MNRSKFFLSVFIMSIFVMTSFLISADNIDTVYAKSITDWQNELDELSKESSELRDKVNDLNGRVEDQVAYRDVLNKEIDTINGSIFATQREIDQVNTYIKGLEQEIENSLNLFKNRLKAMYMADKGSILSSLLSNETFTEYLIYVDSMKRIADYDNKLIEDLTETKRKMEEKKKQVEEQKLSLDRQKIALSQKKQESERIAYELSQQRDKTQKEIRELSQEMAKASNAIEFLIQQESGDGQFVGGTYLYPVTGYYRISSSYGPRIIQGVNDFHTGLDFPAPSGTPILAANSGKVIAVNETSGGYKGGYGKHIIIDHGGKQSTLYAHMSGFNVKVGQYVSRGQVVGYVGSTGWSTGPHLHLEVRINGKHTNPLPYLKKQ